MGKTVYMDGVFDLFHAGHLETIKNLRKYGDTVVIGVVSDTDALSYKRSPIIVEKHRVAIIEACKYVDQVIFPCPLQVSLPFLKENSIDVVVHSFKNIEDYEKQKDFFKEIPLIIAQYSDEINTSDIIQKIINLNILCT